jgi:hypothetical protein
VDNGWGAIGCRIPIGNTKGEVFLAPADSITDHVVERWKPQVGEKYCFISSGGRKNSSTWEDDEVDNNRWNFGNCFRTEQEAVAAKNKIAALLQSL